MPKRVFISHSSKDEPIVTLFVEKILQAGSDVKVSEITYTSQEDMGIMNGDDIPESIKTGIKECDIFFMMISENYRKSEVCLNEMGAAWMCEGIKRKIILLPGIGFNSIGWLMSLKKGTKLDDGRGLDRIHDDVVEILGKTVQTSTWNRNKDSFLESLKKLAEGESLPVSSDQLPIALPAEEDEMDLLELQEIIDDLTSIMVGELDDISNATSLYSDRMEKTTATLNRIKLNQGFNNATVIRGVLVKSAADTNALAEVYERNVPSLRDHFDKLMELGEKQQRLDEERSGDARQKILELLSVINSSREALKVLRSSYDDFPKMEKSLNKANSRLITALNSTDNLFSFFIKRASAFLAI